MPPPQQPVRREFWEVAAASVLIAIRVHYYPWSFLWHDWVVLICAYWIFTALGSKTRAWPWVTGVTMAGLLLLYSWHQIPATLSVLRSGS